MPFTVAETTSSRQAIETARGFLEARPVDHNLLLTILDQSLEYGLDGSYWTVAWDEELVAVGCNRREACRWSSHRCLLGRAEP